MDGEPEILSAGRGGRWTGPGRGRPVTVVLAVLLLSCLTGLAVTAAQLAHRDAIIHELRAAARAAGRQPSAAAGSTALPAASGSALSSFPDATTGTFSMLATAIRPRPGAAPLTWLFVYTRHATPGARYSLLDGTCGGQYVTPADAAQGVADSRGDLTIVAPNLPLGARDASAWVLVYRASDGVTLGGLRGPFIGGHPVPFRTSPPCGPGGAAP
jgi:hypothetical protein